MAESARQSAIALSGGEFLMGSEDPDAYPADREGPVRSVGLEPFAIGATAVTNQQFAEFVAATGYVTDAERHGWSFVFHLLLPDDFPPTRAAVGAEWWRQVYGASWLAPDGPGSSWEARATHPVVHVSWNDACRYARWVGGRLPSEAEWEYAARGGLTQRRYPWGDELLIDGRWMCNIWQGQFPTANSLEDGFLGTAPVNAFEANALGLMNAVGNVWEWCADSYGGPDPHRARGKVLRGGSYLCHESYCFRYRVSARTWSSADASAGNNGLRVAWDATPAGSP